MSDNCEHGVETELYWKAIDYIVETDPHQEISLNVRVFIRCDEDEGHTIGVWPMLRSDAHWLCRFDAAGERDEIEYVN